MGVISDFKVDVGRRTWFENRYLWLSSLGLMSEVSRSLSWYGEVVGTYFECTSGIASSL